MGWGRQAFWMNSVYKVTEDAGGQLMAVCPLYNGVRAQPSGTNEATACPAADQCEVGTLRDQVVQIGWLQTAGQGSGEPYQTADGRQFLQPVPGSFPDRSNICDGLCRWTIEGAFKSDGDWFGTNLINGMYPAFGTAKYKRTGAACNASDREFGNSTPTCDGFQGEVNGVTKCISRQPPVVQSSKTPAASYGGGSATASVSEGKTGPNGERPGKGTDSSGNPDISGTGTKSTGTSTATTVATGSGTATVTTTKIDLATCGLPGKPACKMDESGTPAKPTGLDIDTDAIGSAQQTRRDTITGASDKGMFSGFSSFFLVPPVASCEPIVMPTSQGVQIPSIDPCQTVDGIRGFMAWVWALGGLFLCVGFVRESI
jgi:hypothetical protein